MGVAADIFDVAFHSTMRTADRLVDAAYGVRTGAERRYDGVAADQTRHRDPETNMPSYYLRLLALRRALSPSRDDVLVDLGCGAGRALFVFARTLRIVRGIDFHGEACRLASENARRFNGRGARIEIVHADAAEYPFSDETLVYLFNPFGRATLRAVLDNLRASLIARPRRVRIAYYHPLHADVFDGTPWLRRGPTVHGFKTDIQIFETRSLSQSNLV
jgi:SAM-dependent methyltransferase